MTAACKQIKNHNLPQSDQILYNIVSGSPESQLLGGGGGLDDEAEDVKIVEHFSAAVSWRTELESIAWKHSAGPKV